MSSPILPRYLFISLKSEFTAAISGSEREEGLHTNTLTATGLADSEKGYSTTFIVVGLTSSSEEAAEITSMATKEVLDAGLLLDLKFKEIEALERIVVCLPREVEHH
ncbi:hypothetical protein AMTR_s00006p00189920 [Amborella trichopoda]|uniref:Uncharacterized protein n=1 Tax=Amborella trichopoda TaxID=13333 RepID=W1PCL8_AMBTC|nr:hypothetical protein AMTR_s00006p00189920 [Amborella trichopoda]